MKLTAEQIENCKQLAHEIAPELGENPLYIVNADAFTGLPPIRGTFLGWSTKSSPVNHSLTERIPEYTRPGPIITIDGDAIARETQPGDFDGVLRTVVVHETAHIVPGVASYPDDEPTPQGKDFQLACFKIACQKNSPEPGSSSDPHDHRFIRRAVHLWVRAKATWYDVPTCRLLGPVGSFFSLPEHYLATLAGEVLRMKHETFSTIENEPPPPDFMKVWNYDLKNYERYCKNEHRII